MKIIRWTVMLAYAAGIYYISTRPMGGPEIFPHFDKVMHFVLYAGLAFLVVWALRVTALRFWPFVPVLAAALAVAYGALNELLQLYIPYRSAEFYDVVANTLGAAVGAFAAMRAARSLERRRDTKALKSSRGGEG